MKNFKRIDDYFSDNLTTDLKIEFEQELNSDKDLRNDYETYKASQNLIEFMVQEDLMGKLPQLVSDDEDIQHASQVHSIDNLLVSEKVPGHAESAKIVSIDRPANSNPYNKNEAGGKYFFTKKLRVAASFLILIVAFSAVWLNLRSDNFSNITLTHINYLPLSQMRSGEDSNENYNKLISLEEKGDYKQANNVIDDLMKKDAATYNYLLYFRAQNNFRLQNFAQADKDFEQVIRLNMPKYVEDAQLMRVFTAIELKDDQLAKTRIAELEAQPLYSYKTVLLKIRNEL